MAQAVSRRPLTAEALVRARVSPCGIRPTVLFNIATYVFPFTL
jgi:hypothetical protein